MVTKEEFKGENLLEKRNNYIENLNQNEVVVKEYLRYEKTEVLEFFTNDFSYVD